MAAPGRWSIARRIVYWYAGSVVLLLFLTGFILEMSLETLLEQQADRSLAEKVHIVQNFLLEVPPDLTAARHEVEEEWGHNEYAGVWLRVYDAARSRVIAQTPDMPSFAVPESMPAPPAGADLGAATAVKGPDGVPYRVMRAVVPVRHPATPTPALHPQATPEVDTWEVHAVLTFRREADLLARYRSGLALVLCIVAAASVPLGLLIARRGLSSVGWMSAQVRDLTSTTLHRRLSLAGLPAELTDLGEGFNATLDRLQQSFERLSRFSSNLAHELRTPLNNLRGEVEVTLSRPREVERYREVLESALEEGDRLADIVERMLFLARAEAATELVEAAPRPVGPELEKVREYYEAAAQEAGVSLSLEASEELVAPLDPVLFNRAIANLVSNALEHTPAGGQVVIRAASLDENRLEISVIDTGCGVPADHLPLIFDRFHRADTARTGGEKGGVGLGLSIVQSIARLHGGAVNAESRAGKGTTVRLVLPRRRGSTETSPVN